MATIIEKFGMNCHTTDRFDIYRCYQRSVIDTLRSGIKIPKNETDLLNQFIVDYFERNHMAWIQDNDSCMKQHSSVSQYWEAVEALKSSQDQQIFYQNFHSTKNHSQVEKIIKNPELYMLIATFSAIIFLHYKV